MVVVVKKAPLFSAPAVLGNGETVDSYDFAKAIQGKYAIVVLYPLDFTY
ncbi:peroxiredoxin, partial [Francisella tularensis]|nr:peroxiredoxin [Francisella tularensis]